MKSPLPIVFALCGVTLLSSPGHADNVYVTVEHVSGESGLVYSSGCCVPDFFFPAEGYVETSNCGTTSSGACVQYRSMGIWLYPYPEAPKGGDLMSITVSGDRYPTSQLSGSGLLLLEFASDDFLSSAFLYQVLNSPDQQINMTWPSSTQFTFGIPRGPFEANPQQSHIALVAYKPASTVTYLDNNAGAAPTLTFRYDVEVVDPCPQDIDGNGTVDGGDLSSILGFWGLPVDPPGTGPDLNGDGRVTGADLAEVLSYWGPCS